MVFLWINNTRIDSIPALQELFHSYDSAAVTAAFAEMISKVKKGLVKGWLSHQPETCLYSISNYSAPRSKNNILLLINYTKGTELDERHISQLCRLCGLDERYFDVEAALGKEKQQEERTDKINSVLQSSGLLEKENAATVTATDYRIIDNGQLMEALQDRIENPDIHKVIYIYALKSAAATYTINLNNVKNTEFIGVGNPRIYYSTAATERIDAAKNNLTFKDITINCFGQAYLFNTEKSMGFNQNII